MMCVPLSRCTFQPLLQASALAAVSDTIGWRLIGLLMLKWIFSFVAGVRIVWTRAGQQDPIHQASVRNPILFACLELPFSVMKQNNDLLSQSTRCLWKFEYNIRVVIAGPASCSTNPKDHGWNPACTGPPPLLTCITSHDGKSVEFSCSPTTPILSPSVHQSHTACAASVSAFFTARALPAPRMSSHNRESQVQPVPGPFRSHFTSQNTWQKM